jgi:serine/threonine protein kinase
MGEVVRREAVENGEEITKDDAIDKAVRELDPVFAPELFNEEAIDLIKRLLCKDGKTRLGAVGGAAEVMAHPFFADVNWQEYQDDSIKPPCLPRKDLNYATQNEIGGFAPEEQSGDALTAADREVFSHWNYTRPNAFMEEVVSFMQHEDELGPIQVRTEDSVCCVIS